MIVGLEFDAELELVELRVFDHTSEGRRWVTERRGRARVRSLYEVSNIRRQLRPPVIALAALRRGRLLADSELRA